MAAFIFRRLLSFIPTLFIIILLAFVLLRFAPGSPFNSERAASPEMIEQLNAFVIKDTPFLRTERLQRVKLLRELMDRSDVSVAEKYRRVLGAYQVELDYGRTLEAYRDEIEIDGTPRTVQFLRVGRVGWYYQTLDGHRAAYWDARDQTWVAVKATRRLAIRRALRVASQQAAPELLELPVAAARRYDNE